MTCKDCIHYQVCQDYDHRVMLFYNIAKKCKYFKDKSRIIELPCKVTNGFKEKLTKYCHERCFDEL
jgi:hypothetical protein